MEIRFHKWQGLGNDFVVLDERSGALDLTEARIRGLCDRHFGVGCDQLVLLRAPDGPHADVKILFFNADGSEAGACGNASRCVARLVSLETGRGEVVLQTRGGILPAVVDGACVTVDMGAPRLGWRDVPLARACDTVRLDLPGGPGACSMGNPHATFFVTGTLDPMEAGPALEHDPLFPERANIGFAWVRGRADIRLRVWERGAGLTLACGSGACAAVVNGVRQGVLDRACVVEMDGGVLRIVWREDGHVLMSGPAEPVFAGIYQG